MKHIKQCSAFIFTAVPTVWLDTCELDLLPTCDELKIKNLEKKFLRIFFTNF